jgi:3-hydroxyisobutyrate dehydrogenase-like beta-hydroxyacid dehydrogenase
MQQVPGRIASGDYSTDQATLNVCADASEAFAAAMSTQREPPMIRATARVLRRAVEAGPGAEDIAAVFAFRS